MSRNRDLTEKSPKHIHCTRAELKKMKRSRDELEIKMFKKHSKRLPIIIIKL